MKIVFFATPAFAAPFLEALIEHEGISVAAVVSQPDKPAGRGNALVPTPIKALAQAHGIPVMQPPSLKREDVRKDLARIDAHAFVVVAYGKLIPPSILEIPALGCVNVHPSLLPRHRGPSPIQRAIAEGDANTGVSIMLLDEGMDTGPILASERIESAKDETYPSLVEKVQRIGPRLLARTLERYAAGEIAPMPQDDAQATVTRLLTREDGRVDWHQPLAAIHRALRAYQPWPGAWNEWNRDGKTIRLKWLDMHPTDMRAHASPGTVRIDGDRLYIEAKDGTMEILRLQREGKPAADAAAFIAGHGDIDGMKLA